MKNCCTRVRTISILELGRVVGIRSCEAHGTEVFIRGERSKTIYMAFPCNIVSDTEDKPEWLEVGNRVVIEHHDDAAGYKISEWKGNDDMRGFRFDLRKIAPLLGPCHEA